uniref:Uncharacterized protein n=1 Tax=viral metagenome TaxID=1070528 RepID=A0A6C0ACL4_9ZZZZ
MPKNNIIEEFNDLINNTTIYDYEFLSSDEINKKYTKLNKTGKEFIMLVNWQIYGNTYAELINVLNNSKFIIDQTSIKLKLFLKDGSILRKKCFIKIKNNDKNKILTKVKFYCNMAYRKYINDDIDLSYDYWSTPSPITRAELTFRYGAMSDQFKEKLNKLINKYKQNKHNTSINCEIEEVD